MSDSIRAFTPVPVPCRFRVRWGAECKKPSGDGWCTEHAQLTCTSCDTQATRLCGYISAQVERCRRPLCDSCQHEPYHPRHAPTPSRHLNAAEYRSTLELIEKAA